MFIISMILFSGVMIYGDIITIELSKIAVCISNCTIVSIENLFLIFDKRIEYLSQDGIFYQVIDASYQFIPNSTVPCFSDEYNTYHLIIRQTYLANSTIDVCVFTFLLILNVFIFCIIIYYLRRKRQSNGFVSISLVPVSLYNP